MKTFRIEYTEGDCPEVFTSYTKGIDMEHAEMRFIDSMERQGGNEGVRIVSISKVKTI